MINLKSIKAWISGVKEEPVAMHRKEFPPRPDYLCSFNEWAELTKFSTLHTQPPKIDERLDPVKKEVKDANKHF